MHRHESEGLEINISEHMISLWYCKTAREGRVTYQIRLGVITLGAEDKLPDEPVQHVLQLARLVGSIHNVAASLWVHLRLSAKLTAKILAGVCRGKRGNKIIESSHSTPPIAAALTRWRPVQSLSYFNHVDYHRLNPVSFALHLEANRDRQVDKHTEMKLRHST